MAWHSLTGKRRIMLISELTKQASLDLLASIHIGRLACARGTQPYVVPIHFAYDNYFLYGFSMAGQKIEWMRANPLVCVDADDIVSPEQWTSLIVFGRYEELPDTPQMQGERAFAANLFQQRPLWWEPGYITTSHGGSR